MSRWILLTNSLMTFLEFVSFINMTPDVNKSLHHRISFNPALKDGHVAFIYFCPSNIQCIFTNLIPFWRCSTELKNECTRNKTDFLLQSTSFSSAFRTNKMEMAYINSCIKCILQFHHCKCHRKRSICTRGQAECLHRHIQLKHSKGSERKPKS